MDDFSTDMPQMWSAGLPATDPVDRESLIDWMWDLNHFESSGIIYGSFEDRQNIEKRVLVRLKKWGDPPIASLRGVLDDEVFLHKIKVEAELDEDAFLRNIFESLLEKFMRATEAVPFRNDYPTDSHAFSIMLFRLGRLHFGRPVVEWLDPYLLRYGQLSPDQQASFFNAIWRNSRSDHLAPFAKLLAQILGQEDWSRLEISEADSRRFHCLWTDNSGRELLYDHAREGNPSYLSLAWCLLQLNTPWNMPLDVVQDLASCLKDRVPDSISPLIRERIGYSFKVDDERRQLLFNSISGGDLA